MVHLPFDATVAGVPVEAGSSSLYAMRIEWERTGITVPILRRGVP